MLDIDQVAHIVTSRKKEGTTVPKGDFKLYTFCAGRYASIDSKRDGKFFSDGMFAFVLGFEPINTPYTIGIGLLVLTWDALQTTHCKQEVLNVY